MMPGKLSVGDQAPDFIFATPWNNQSNFHKIIGYHNVALIFLRYIGQVEMSNIKRNITLLSGKNAMVFVVLQSNPETVASICNQADWPFTIICDPQAKIFKLYHVEAGGIFKYFYPAGLVAAIKAIIAGNKHGKFEDKETQLPASFIINTNKIIKYAYYGKWINDVPSLETMVAYINN